LAAEAKRVLVCSAWPYASNVPHLGNLIGSLLSGDAFMRYYRLRGCEVLHVSGSDMHGTHIEYEARQQGLEPKALAERVHRQILEILKAFEIDMHYTSTESPTHYRFVRDVYKKAEQNDYIFAKTEERAFCTHDQVFLADRFIQGTCPYCGSPNAYGNQCDDCGALLEPEQLIDPICRLCNQRSIVFKATRNWYLDLPKLKPQLERFLASRRFSPNVQRFTESLLKEGLKPRAVTRDLKWGIPAPFAGAEGKVLYVWAEAALGYVSATIEHFEQKGEPDGWRRYWLPDPDDEPNVQHVYTQGKDNVPFHTIFFPAQLLATGEPYHLPDQIAATEYLNWLRFYLFSFRPETRDIDFSWEDLEKAINGVLVNNIANLIHRVATLTHRKYGGRRTPSWPPPFARSGIWPSWATNTSKGRSPGRSTTPGRSRPRTIWSRRWPCCSSPSSRRSPGRRIGCSAWTPRGPRWRTSGALTLRRSSWGSRSPCSRRSTSRRWRSATAGSRSNKRLELGRPAPYNGVLLVRDGDEVKIGQPYVEGAAVRATIAEEFKGEKIRGFKYKPKKRYRRRYGHRQRYMRAQIEEIQA